MDWLVFADDWGVHPSTTQHLVRALPAGDRVVWINSLGMRSPRLSLGDLGRVAGRLRAMASPTGGAPSGGGPPEGVEVVQPRFLPWHGLLRPLNRRVVGAQVRAALAARGLEAPVALLSNPVAVGMLEGLPLRAVIYLRLDDYGALPGVDAELIEAVEAELLARADLLVATARPLLPEGLGGDRGRYLPQGVDVAHFAEVPVVPPGGRVLGFFGLLAPWIDLDLVAEVAKRAPRWTVELLGPSSVEPGDLAPLRALDNVVLREAVAYEALPAATAHWRAAWAPFVRGRCTEGVNPLKLREYLAAGWPTACTPLPAAVELEGPVRLVEGAEDVLRWLEEEATTDSAERRAARRATVAGEGWGQRAQTLRTWASALGQPG